MPPSPIQAVTNFGAWLGFTGVGISWTSSYNQDGRTGI
jgi:hypothetical protein